MKNPLCRIGIHNWRDWAAHTNGPCVFPSEVHIFRYCKHCHASQHAFIPVNNGDKPYRQDECNGVGKPDLQIRPDN